MTFVLLSGMVLAAMTAAVKPWQASGTSIFDTSFFMGPAAKSLIEGHGMLFCSDGMGTVGNPICYKAGRMPVTPLILAIGERLLGDRPALIVCMKILIFTLPFWAAAGVVLWKARRNAKLLLLSWLLLFAPCLVLNYTGVVITADVEEAYLFGLLGLALSLAMIRMKAQTQWLIALGVTLDLLFLCKSSMLPVVLVLAVMGMLQLQSWSMRLSLLAIVCAAPLLWGAWQNHASGRFSLGTSMDGINLHKGNNGRFQERYPGLNGVLDAYDVELNAGQHFDAEWQFNDYHLGEAKRFMLSHPGYTAHSDWRKLDVMLLTQNRHARTEATGARAAAASAGVLLFRVLEWSSLAIAAWSVISGRILGRTKGAAYLAFVAAYCAPYIAGFGYMRHAIILLFPAAILLSLALQDHLQEPVSALPLPRDLPSNLSLA
jgi:hypothetical protein